MAMFTPSTMALLAFGITAEISPSLPLSLPASTTTLSPFFNLAAILQHLRSERDDLHEVLRTQLTHNWPEDTGANRLVVVVEDHGRIAVETDGCAIFAANFFCGAHDNGLTDIAFFYTTAWDGFLHGDHDDVTHRGIFPLGSTQNLDALNSASARVVSYIQISLHLDHSGISRPLGAPMRTLPPG